MKEKNPRINKVLIVAPFWQRTGHVGNYRIDRFIRWLRKNDCLVYVLKAGRKNDIQEKEWGIEITKKDYIFIITETLRLLSNKQILKLIWYAWLSLILLFSPVDEFFLWASRILSRVDLAKYFKDIDIVISSSPPNSSHIAAYKISKKYAISLVTDFRDGWLDEPLEQKLKKIKFLRKKEKSWEKKIIELSSKIIVTSETWEKMLQKRYPTISKKNIVITNAYPEFVFLSEGKENNSNSEIKIRLLYTGRFAGSRKSQKLDLLLFPIFNAISKSRSETEIIFLSDLRREELKIFWDWKAFFSSVNVSLVLQPQVSRLHMFEIINLANGLLLLSNGMGPLPGKLFEYIKSGKPIMAVTPKGSAVWQLSEKLPQLYLYDNDHNGDDYTPVVKFLDACKSGDYNYKIPVEYSEDFLSKLFLSEIESLLT